MRGSLLVQGSHDPLLDLAEGAFRAALGREHVRGAGSWLAERSQRLVSANVGSLGGLVALRRGESASQFAGRMWARICWMERIIYNNLLISAEACKRNNLAVLPASFSNLAGINLSPAAAVVAGGAGLKSSPQDLW